MPGETKIYVNTKLMTIEDFYKLSKGIIENYADKKYIKYLNDKYITKSYDKDLVESPIKYVMKHPVKKEFFEITANGKSVIVTEDHSLQVEREGKLIEISPKDLRKTDLLIINVQ